MTEHGRPVWPELTVPVRVPDFTCCLCGRHVAPWDTVAILRPDAPSGVDYICDRCYDVQRETVELAGG